MAAPRKPRSRNSAPRQRGQAFLFTAVLVALGVLALVLTTAGSESVSIANRQADNTARTLAQVKEALIAWSASRTPTGASPNRRPGELPCPDTDNSGTDAGACAAGAIGRVPWKSLGIPEPKDGTGETLWYAIAGPFRNYGMTTDPITSDTLGNLTLYLESSATTLTSQAIAVIFAPGAALDTQDRNAATTALCATTGTTIARNLCPTNYLEATGGGDNAQTAGPFINAPASSTFNDRVLAITTADLMPAVERRVAREMMSILESYQNATGVYPWADLADGDSNGSGSAYYNRNRFPCGNALPTSWGGAGISLPNWLTNGCDCTAGTFGWTCVIFYAVAKNRLQGSGSNCTTCASTTTTCGSTTTSTTLLTVSNSGNGISDLCTTGGSPFTCTPTVLTTGTADLVLITPGAATTNRASGWPVSFSSISNYFEDSSNSDNNDYNCYVVPTSTSNDRDRIYVVR